MGSLAFNKCYPDAQSASDAYFTSAVPPLGSEHWFEKQSGEWMFATNTDGITTYTEAHVPTFAECDVAEGFQDGISVGWLVAGCILTAWAVTQIRRQIR